MRRRRVQAATGAAATGTGSPTRPVPRSRSRPCGGAAHRRRGMPRLPRGCSGPQRPTREVFDLAQARLRTRLDDQGFDTADEVAAAAMTAADLAVAAEQLATAEPGSWRSRPSSRIPRSRLPGRTVRMSIRSAPSASGPSARPGGSTGPHRAGAGRPDGPVATGVLAALAVQLSSALDELRVVTVSRTPAPASAPRTPADALVGIRAGWAAGTGGRAGERTAGQDGRRALPARAQRRPRRRGAKSGLGCGSSTGGPATQGPGLSLSGGETFMASLALALGLADAVRVESGGSTCRPCSSTRASAASTTTASTR